MKHERRSETKICILLRAVVNAKLQARDAYYKLSYKAGVWALDLQAQMYRPMEVDCVNRH